MCSGCGAFEERFRVHGHGLEFAESLQGPPS